MGKAYPELVRAQPLIVETLRAEEERFRRTLGRGMSLLDEATAGLSSGGVLAGETAFKLYDTYGFPLDLTQDAVRAKGLTVDTDGFDAAMERQRAQGREAWTGSGQSAQGAGWLAVRDRLGPTDFTGHDDIVAASELLAIAREGEQVESAQAGETVELLFDRTPFYAEGGGQAGDTGLIEWDGGAGQVLDTRKEAGDLHVHVVKITGGALKLGQRATLSVDAAKRLNTRSNHSAAHLVHAALAHVLGPHVAQKGQLVDGERMRFDFSHSGPLTADELDRVEAEVNAVIRQNLPARTEIMAPDEAIAAGAVALFGEKYGSSVRVLTLGKALTGDEKPYSVELCGGTHVARTGDIALFKIVAETGIAAGVRRVEALTGEAARRYLLDQAAVAKDLADRFKTPVADVAARVEALDAQRRQLEKQLADAKRQLALGGGGAGGASEPEDIGGVKLIARVLDGVDGKGLRPVVEDFRKGLGSGVVALVGVTDGKAAISVAVTADLAGGINAADLARAAVLAMGGQGAGGKPDFAQGGAPDGSKAQDGLTAIRAALKG
jgi:alanyl-tRNA synthetase